MDKKTVTFLKVDDLVLDTNNPRFGELYTGSNKEDDLIEYLLFTESAISIAEHLSVKKEFYIDKPLLVLEENKKFLVKDGNRRCAAAKALLNPEKFGVNLPAFKFSKLPVVIYKNKKEIENRIIEEHTNNMFREWDRIAKAMEIYRQFKSGSSLESMQEIDSEPVKLIKLASFYYTAVKIGGDNMRKLLRKGRGNTGGKTTIFERLFKYSGYFGYRFKNKPYYTIEVIDNTKFKKYIKEIVNYLINNPTTTYRDVDDKNPEMFNTIGLSKLVNVNRKKLSSKSFIRSKHINKSQQRPQYNRTISASLKKVIDECYDLDETNFTNSKIAMTRIVFECSLKYILEETEYNGKKLRDYDYFKGAFFNKKDGKKLKWTNFTELKTLFENLISNNGIANAFKDFELEKPNQIIHNYNIIGLVNDSKNLCVNLIPLVEFMLENKDTFLQSIDLSKLK